VDTGAGWEERKLTLDDILPAWSISSFAVGTTVLEVGQTYTNPTFTAAYSATPVSASIAGSLGGSVNLTTPFTSGTITGSYCVSGPTSLPYGQITWTLTANGPPSHTAPTYSTWYWLGYWGSADSGVYNAAYCTGLGSSTYEIAYAQTQAFTPASTNYLCFCWPTAFGTPSGFKDANTGFAVPTTKLGSAVSVTNSHGASANYDIWCSDNNHLANPTTVQVY
jgi:hypothetical protein